MGQRPYLAGILVFALFAASGCTSAVPVSINSDIKTAADLIAQKQDQKSAAVLEKILAQDPTDPKANFYAALIDEHNRKYEDALAKLNTAIEKDPRYSEAYSERAVIETRLGTYPAALADANQSIRLQPEVPVNHLRRAIIAIQTKDWKTALDALETVERLDSKGSAYWIAAYRAEAYMGLKDYKRSKEYFDLAEKIGGKEHSVLYLRIANLLARTGEFNSARTNAERFLATDPDAPSAHALLGALLCIENDQRGAREEYKKAIAGRGTAADMADTIDLGADHCSTVTEFADIYLNKKDAESAQALLTKIESHRPLEPQEQYRAALANFALKRPDQAISQLNAAISMAPDYIEPRVALIHYYAKNGLSTKALELQREAFSIAHTAHEKSLVAGAIAR